MDRASRLGVATLLGLLACSEVTFEEGLPLSITLSADKTSAQVEEEISFTFEAQGRALVGVTLAYGDGQVDSVFAAGAQRAGALRTHAYEEPGNFVVIARAIETFGEEATDELAVEIVP